VALHFQDCNAFVLVRFLSHVGTAIRPVNSGQGALNYCPLDLENQFGILAKKNAKKAQYAFFPDQRAGLWEIEFSAIGEQISEPGHIPGIDKLKKA
jgi:hypothetical protein